MYLVLQCNCSLVESFDIDVGAMERFFRPDLGFSR